MYTLIIVLMVLASILLCGIVLIQESKGGGLASGFSAGNQFAGVRKTTDLVEKATWGLALSLVIFSVLSVAFLPKEAKNDTLRQVLATHRASQQDNPSLPLPTTPSKHRQMQRP